MKHKSLGQNLVEFALVTPILLMILVVISEFGYTFMVKHTIIDSMKQTVKSSEYSVGRVSSEAELLGQMKTYLLEYINSHNLPTPVDLSLALGNSNQYGTAITITYTYNPSFRIMGITPEQITIKSTQVLQNGLVKTNNPTVPYVSAL